MTEQIVYLLKAVQIDQKDGHLLLVAMRAENRLLKAVLDEKIKHIPIKNIITCCARDFSRRCITESQVIESAQTRAARQLLVYVSGSLSCSSKRPSATTRLKTYSSWDDIAGHQQAT